MDRGAWWAIVLGDAETWTQLSDFYFCNAGDLGLIPESGRSPVEGNDNSLQFSCLENAMERGAWWATVHGVSKSGTRLSG